MGESRVIGGGGMIPKFRAWDRTTNQMRGCYGFNDMEQEVYVCSVADDEFNGRLKTVHALKRSFDEVVIMKSTGLKDKNGVEIYKGDIVKYTWDSPSDINATEKGKKVRISKVFWSDWRASWAVGKKSCNGDLFRYIRNGNTVEVIGNIWEDGDLLNGE